MVFLKHTFPRMLMAHAIPTCPTPTTVILLFGTAASSATDAISFSLRVAIVYCKKRIKILSIHLHMDLNGNDPQNVAILNENPVLKEPNDILGHRIYFKEPCDQFNGEFNQDKTSMKPIRIWVLLFGL